MIYSMRGVVEWLIKYEAKPSALSDTRPLLECCKSCTAQPRACINWFIVMFSDLDHHVQCLASSTTLAPSGNTNPVLFKLIFVTNYLTMSYFEQQ